MSNILEGVGIHVSRGNSKLGRIMNWSLTPGASCSVEACATCMQDGCYAMKAYRMYPQTRKAWDDNLEFCAKNLPAFKCIMSMYITIMKPTFFRVHTAGDFFSQEYAEAWAEIARRNPKVKFLAFTKQFENIRDVEFPKNFTLMVSAWPGCEIPVDIRETYHVAWMQDGTETRIPETAVECSGDCSSCKSCWGTKTDTYFHKH